MWVGRKIQEKAAAEDIDMDEPAAAAQQHRVPSHWAWECKRQWNGPGGGE